MTEQNNMVAVIAVANHKRDHDNHEYYNDINWRTSDMIRCFLALRHCMNIIMILIGSKSEIP